MTNPEQINRRRKNGHTNMWDTLINDTALMRDLSFEDFLDSQVETMLTQYKIAVEDFPRQRAVSAVLDDNPPMDFLLRYRRQQFASLALQFAMLPSDQKDEFCSGLVEWWELVRANEDRAERHLAEHKRRAS
jgi:hypothetical protein